MVGGSAKPASRCSAAPRDSASPAVWGARREIEEVARGDFGGAWLLILLRGV